MNTRSSFPCIEPLEARIAPAAMLHTTSVVAKILPTTVPGDSVSVKFTVENQGDTAFTGTSGIHLQLSPDAIATTPLNDYFVAEFEDQPMGIGPGDSKTFTKSFKMPALNLPSPSVPSGTYYVVVDVRQADNYGIDVSDPTSYVFQFGQVGDRKGVILRASDGDGTQASFKLSGEGTGQLQPGGGVVNLAFGGVDANTIAGATAAGGDGAVLLHDIGFAGPMKGIVMPGVNADGNITFGAGLEGIQLKKIGTAAAHTVLTLGAGDGKPTKMRFEKVTEMDFNIARGITSLTLGEWDNTNGAADNLNAPFIQKLALGDPKAGLPGNFEGNLNLTSADGKGFALMKATSGGQLGGTWTVTGAGKVGDISAKSASQWKLLADQAVDDVFIAGDFVGSTASPALRASIFGDIKVGGKLQASIEATAGNAKGVAIEKLVASDVNGINVEAPQGGIPLIDVGQWLGGGTIHTRVIKVLSTDGAFVSTDGDFNANLDLSGPPVATPASYALLKASIEGGITGGTWNVHDRIGEIKAARTAAAWTVVQDTNGTFDGLSAKGELAGNITARAFLEVEAGGTLKAIMRTTRSATDNFQGFLEVKAARIEGAQFTGPGGIVTLRAGDWIGGMANVYSILDLILTKRAGSTGSLANVDITMTGLGNSYLTVAGGMTDVDIIAMPGMHIEKIQTSDWVTGSLQGDTLGDLTLNGSAGNLTNVSFGLTNGIRSITVPGKAEDVHITSTGDIQSVLVGAMVNSEITATGKRIEKFELRGLANSGGAPAYSNSMVTASKIGTAIVRDVDTTPGGDYGFEVHSIDAYTRFTGGVRTVPIQSVTAPGDFDRVTNYRVFVS